MSAYGGAIDLQGGEVQPAVLRGLDRAQCRQGGTAHHWARTGAALGHLHAAPGPVGTFASTTDSLYVVGDIQLDNRQELARALRKAREAVVPAVPQGPIAASGAVAERVRRDAALLLAAYRVWGPAGAARMRGAFAAALWDDQAQRLVAMRDHAGVRSFFYHQPAPGRLVFGGQLPWVLAAMAGPCRISRTRVGDFLAGLHATAADTFYEGIQRLPPAHVLVMTTGSTTVQAYWRMAGEASPPNTSSGAYEEAFRRRFDQAVQRRLPRRDDIGTFLSGGLDSTSITATADRYRTGPPLHTFSAVYDTLASCDERPFIEQVTQAGDYQVHYVDGEDHRPLMTMKKLVALHHEPLFAPNMSVSWRLYQAAQAAGVTTILHGHGGDEVVSQGYGRLKELARAGRWLTLARELRGAAQIAGTASWQGLLARYVERYAVAPAAERSALWARILRKLAHLGRQWSPSTTGNPPASQGGVAWVQPAFAERIGLTERVQAARTTDPRGTETEAERHARTLRHPRQPLALEIIARTGRHLGVDTRFPFWDPDLVTYCLGLPSDQKLRDGWGRAILRHSMTGRLPRGVQWRRDKTDFTANLRQGLAREREQLNALILNNEAVAEEYIQTSVLHDIRTKFVAAPNSCSTRELFLLWKAAVLLVWLRATG